MSDHPRGPGWWQAGDGRFYPPEAAPGPSDDIVAGASHPPNVAVRPAPRSAAVALGLSIASFLICPGVLAIAALVVAAKASNEIKSGEGSQGGSGMVAGARAVSIANLLLLPLILAIAIPTVLGARIRAQDRAAETTLRRSVVAAQLLYANEGAWPAVDELSVAEPKVRFATSDGRLEHGVVDVTEAQALISLSTKSRSGKCFYLASLAGGQRVGFAVSSGCGPPNVQDYRDRWLP